MEIEEKLDVVDKRLQKVELCVESNFDGERSVWAAIEKLTKSIDESNKKQSDALRSAVDTSIKDREELHAAVVQQQIDMKIFATAYSTLSGWLKTISVILITSMLGIVVGLLTHTIQIP